MAEAISLGARLRQLVVALDGEVQGLYNAADIPFRPRFYPFVQHLLEIDDASVRMLAAAAAVSQPAATQTLDEMKRAGLVEPAGSDSRRERRVRLTAASRALAERLAPTWRAIELAAAELARELPHRLSRTIDLALAALQERPFGERVRTMLPALEKD